MSDVDLKLHEELEATKAALARAEAQRDELAVALNAAVRIANEAQEEWDKAPNGMRAGKILLALAGHIPNYREDIRAIHRVRLDPGQGPLVEALLAGEQFVDAIMSFGGQNLKVMGWHMNGQPEPFDSFLDDNNGSDALWKLQDAVKYLRGS